MPYAFVSGGVVVNVAQVTPANLENWVEVPAEQPARIGWAYTGGAFIEPPPSQEKINARNAPVVTRMVNERLERRAKALADEGDRIGALELRVQMET